MKIIATSVNNALNQFLFFYLYGNDQGFILEDSRNGPVASYTEPVITEYLFPCNRVLNSSVRAANPFFHLIEAIWMLAGSNDVRFISYYNKRMLQYSDDGQVLNAAYGHRWRNNFEVDQLADIIEMLMTTPNTRRAVLQMWDANYDLKSDSRDLPCNTQCYFRIMTRQNTRFLDMTVCSRSGDTFWGVYGANAVHFSILLEYLATILKVKVGIMYHLVNNQHIYTEEFPRNKVVDIYNDLVNCVGNKYSHKPLICFGEEERLLDDDIFNFVDNPNGVVYNTEFFSQVVSPMHRSWVIWKEGGDAEGALESLKLNGEKGIDWIEAGKSWLTAKLLEKEHATRIYG